MLIGVQSSMNPEFGFFVEVNERIIEAKRLIKSGLEDWLMYNEPKHHLNPLFKNKEDRRWIESSCYTEPPMWLLDKVGISHGEPVGCFDDEGKMLPQYEGLVIYMEEI